ncbi:hypothetical protein C0581_05310 [Candidatus Parcubacteria bacterium]|nr:MAG: hypothetical protein C0581_05310 [Candidatus Parcubacteria bacterium]
MDINYLAVFVAAVVSMILGFTWYAMPVFGKRWLASLEPAIREKIIETNKVKKGMGLVAFLGFVGSLLTTYVVAYFAGGQGWQAGMKVGVLLWLGFSVPMVLGGVLWEKKTWANFWINIPYYLLMLLIVGVVVGMWK